MEEDMKILQSLPPACYCIPLQSSWPPSASFECTQQRLYREIIIAQIV